jgi:hypothetical protein
MAFRKIFEYDGINEFDVDKIFWGCNRQTEKTADF